ncbi:MAG: hypothetical protein WBG86_01645, partial [Polyangiales bacterium]
MYEGAFRILRVFGDGRSRTREEAARDSGEAISVVREAADRYAQWFVEDGTQLRASERGLA